MTRTVSYSKKWIECKKGPSRNYDQGPTKS